MFLCRYPHPHTHGDEFLLQFPHVFTVCCNVILHILHKCATIQERTWLKKVHGIQIAAENMAGESASTGIAIFPYYDGNAQQRTQCSSRSETMAHQLLHQIYNQELFVAACQKNVTLSVCLKKINKKFDISE
eukprot:m.431397 g.431397  ORF g.431397 m.431397 type:complete len:132 (+) comp21403_c1_seq5:976-1371(+)